MINSPPGVVAALCLVGGHSSNSSSSNDDDDGDGVGIFTIGSCSRDGTTALLARVAVLALDLLQQQVEYVGYGLILFRRSF